MDNIQPSNHIYHSNLGGLNGTLCVYCNQIISHGALAVR